MSRLVLFALTIGLLKNEVKCGTLGKISKFEESLMPRARGTLPSNATQLNPELSSLHEVLVNASGRTDRAEGKNSSRKGKFFFPHVAFVAGVNVGDLPAASNANLASVAKISEAKVSSPVFNPYITATFGPYSPVPPPNLVQQYIASMQRLLDQFHRQFDGGNALLNTSIQHPGLTSYEPLTAKGMDNDVIDYRKRFNAKARLDRLNMAKKAAEKQRMEQLEELDYDYDEEEVPRAPERLHRKKKINAKQAVPMMDEAEDNMNTTNTNTTNNNTYPYNPGYYGGYPQQIGNIGLTYGVPQSAYPPPPNSFGPPANNYGPPSNTYGPPFNTYGPPSNTYGPPSNTYGPPSNTYGTPSNTYGVPAYANAQWPSVVNGSPLYPNALQPYLSYGTPQFTSVRDQPAFYEELPFGVSLASPEPWQQYPPLSGNSQFARSRKFVSSTSSSPKPNRNGFVPI